MKKVKKFLNPMKAILKDYQMSAKNFKILIQKQMPKQERMIAIQIQKEYVMRFQSIMMKNQVRMKIRINNIKIIKNIIPKIIQTYFKNKLQI